LMMPIHDPEKFMNPNCVKVVVDRLNRALYFSRSPIPYLRDGGLPATAFQHIGIYAFRKKALLEFTQMPPSPLEQSEKLENLRMLENGWAVHMAEVESVGISIDTPEDFLAADLFLQQKGE
jgi:3-deoxy-manno-octulosonate cytidylyltransferase (CMP-KDO synthetase)